MKELTLSNCERKVMVDDSDYEALKKFRWRMNIGGGGCRRGMPQIRAKYSDPVTRKNKDHIIHRLIMSAPSGLVVDHINGNIYDNRRQNLRVCTQAQNVFNQRKTVFASSSEYKGVTFRKKYTKKWQARLRYEGADVFCASFETEKAAAIAYDLAAKLWFGDFARCNILPHGA